MDGTCLAEGYICKGFLCTLPRQKATKSVHYYPQGNEATHENTKKHKEWNLVGLEGRCSNVQILTSLQSSGAPWNIPYDTCDQHGVILQQSLYIVHHHALEKMLHIEPKKLKFEALQPTLSRHMQHLELCLKATSGAKNK